MKPRKIEIGGGTSTIESQSNESRDERELADAEQSA